MRMDLYLLVEKLGFVTFADPHSMYVRKKRRFFSECHVANCKTVTQNNSESKNLLVHAVADHKRSNEHAFDTFDWIFYILQSFNGTQSQDETKQMVKTFLAPEMFHAQTYGNRCDYEK